MYFTLKVISNCRILDENASKEDSEKLTVLISLSPQAVLSIAARHSLGADECAQKLASRSKEMYDLTFMPIIKFLLFTHCIMPQP